MVRVALLALAVSISAGVAACTDETFEKPPDYDLSKPIRDLSAVAPPHDLSVDLSVAQTTDLAKRDLATTVVDLRLPIPDAL